MCAVTRTVQPVGDLLRFVRQKDGALLLDLRCRLPGRGLWITAERKLLAQAKNSKIFNKGFKAHTSVPENLEDEVDAALFKAALGMFSLCNKAGKVLCGFAKAEKAIEQFQAAIVLHASDGAEDGLRKMRAAAWRTQQKALPFMTVFNSMQMSMALGRENVVHAALLTDPVSSATRVRLEKLVKYRADAGLPEATGQTAGTDTE